MSFHMKLDDPFPIVVAKGGDYDRGVQIGRTAKTLISRNVNFYLNLWSQGGHSKDWILSEAAKLSSVIGNYSPSILEEMKGVAEGSGISLEEIIALNSRWEIFYLNFVKNECTAVSADSGITSNHHMVLAQNWDYLPAVRSNCILLKELQEPVRPNILIHTEAGILGHKGMNSDGLGLVVNGMSSDKDKFEQRVPFLVMVREALNQRTLTAALSSIVKAQVSVSGNILLAQAGGIAVDVECAPFDYAVLYDEDGILAHANVFCDARLSIKLLDEIKSTSPDSIIRSSRAAKLVAKNIKDADVIEAFKMTLSDHFGRPNSICRHPDPTVAESQRVETLVSVIMDLDSKTMYLSNGNPCSNSYVQFQLDAIGAN